MYVIEARQAGGQWGMRQDMVRRSKVGASTHVGEKDTEEWLGELCESRTRIMMERSASRERRSCSSSSAHARGTRSLAAFAKRSYAPSPNSAISAGVGCRRSRWIPELAGSSGPKPSPNAPTTPRAQSDPHNQAHVVSLLAYAKLRPGCDESHISESNQGDGRW